MDEPLFPGYEAPPVEELSPDRRRTARQQADVEAGRERHGGRLHVLASRHRDADAPKDDPFTCGTCWFREVLSYHNRSYAKCVAGDGIRVTHGAGSDVRAWWPACPDYSPSDRLSSDAARTVYPADEA